MSKDSQQSVREGEQGISSRPLTQLCQPHQPSQHGPDLDVPHTPCAPPHPTPGHYQMPILAREQAATVADSFLLTQNTGSL